MLFTVTAGHDDKDPGAVAISGETEAQLMLELRHLVAAKLYEKGHQVRTDGSRWQNLPLIQAMGLIPGSHAAIELHTNAFHDPRAGGVEVISLPNHKLRAQRLAASISNVLGIPLRGDRGWIDQSKSARGRLGFVNKNGMIVEVFFISNPSELAAYKAKKWLVAEAIANALINMN